MNTRLRRRCRKVEHPDRLLTDAPAIAASSDSRILDQAPRWFNLVRTAIDRHVSGARIVDLSAERSDEEAG